MPLNQPQAVELHDEPFNPGITLARAFRYWWLVAALMVLGGIAGWLVYSARPPLYEARAQFSLTVDVVSTGPLTQYEEDLIINTSGHIFDSQEVLQLVAEEAGQAGIATTPEDLRERILLERKFSVWYLRVRHPDASVARQIITIWLDQGRAVLEDSYAHALQAQTLERYIRTQEICLEAAAASEPALGVPTCPGFAQVQESLRAAGAALIAEKQSSRGLSPALTIGPFNPPEVSSTPVTTGQGQYVFLGGLIGLTAALAWIEFMPTRLPGRKHTSA